MNGNTVIWTPPEEALPGGGRKRVGKACNRCRLKKCRCDGLSACSRCIADNAICSFERQKKPQHKRPVPDGYVEMLEEQRSKLVSGLCEMYKRLQNANAWTGPPLSESGGNPLTHEILAALNILSGEEQDDDISSDDFDTQSSGGSRSASIVAGSENDLDAESIGSGALMPGSLSPAGFSPSCTFDDMPVQQQQARGPMRPQLQTHHSMPAHMANHLAQQMQQSHSQPHHPHLQQHYSHSGAGLSMDPVLYQDEFSALDLDRSGMQHGNMDFSLLESPLQDSAFGQSYNLGGYGMNFNDALNIMSYNHPAHQHIHLDGMEV